QGDRSTTAFSITGYPTASARPRTWFAIPILPSCTAQTMGVRPETLILGCSHAGPRACRVLSRPRAPVQALLRRAAWLVILLQNPASGEASDATDQARQDRPQDLARPAGERSDDQCRTGAARGDLGAPLPAPGARARRGRVHPRLPCRRQ